MLTRPIGYRPTGSSETFRSGACGPGGLPTDLTSVPWLFTWLVPKTGAHLPAALLHDGLVGDHDDPPSYLSS